MVIVDTSAWIFALRKNPSPVIKERIDHLLKENSVSIVPIIRLELLGGVKTRKDFNRLRERLAGLNVIQFSEQVWDGAAELAFDLRRKGLTAPYTDVLISASAIEHKIVVLHADSHFDLIGKNSSLKVESHISSVR